MTTEGAAVLYDLEAGREDASLFIALVNKRVTEWFAGNDVEIKKADIDLLDLAELAAEIAADAGSRLIADINVEKKQRVARIISRGLKQGWSDAEIEQRIVNVVGLTIKQTNAVENFRQHQVDIGTPRGVARNESRKYARRLRGQRAELIAQHELRWALNEAQRRLWEEQLLTSELRWNTTRQWVTQKAEGPCPVCRPMHMKRAKIGELYDNGLPGPPAHPRCKCEERVTAKGFF